MLSLPTDDIGLEGAADTGLEGAAEGAADIGLEGVDDIGLEGVDDIGLEGVTDIGLEGVDDIGLEGVDDIGLEGVDDLHCADGLDNDALHCAGGLDNDALHCAGGLDYDVLHCAGGLDYNVLHCAGGLDYDVLHCAGGLDYNALHCAGGLDYDVLHCAGGLDYNVLHCAGGLDYDVLHCAGGLDYDVLHCAGGVDYDVLHCAGGLDYDALHCAGGLDYDVLHCAGGLDYNVLHCAGGLDYDVLHCAGGLDYNALHCAGGLDYDVLHCAGGLDYDVLHCAGGLENDVLHCAGGLENDVLHCAGGLENDVLHCAGGLDYDVLHCAGENTSKQDQPTILPPYCDEHINVTWASWSPWIQSGDHDIRFRRCHDENKVKVNAHRCKGDYFERRQCAEKEADVCRTTDGSVTEQYHVRCHGLDLDDVDNAEILRDPNDQKEDCQYTLYDIKYRMTIGNPLNTDGLQHADRKLWCSADDKFIPFYTPKQRCLDNLKTFCKMTKVCKYDKPKAEERRKAISKQTCWKDFVLGGILPTGIPEFKSQQMICQHYDKDSKFGEAFGHKNMHFATLYDTKRRLPLVSMVTVRSLGDEKWPNVPFMIERGLVEETSSSVVSWFFRNKKKGIVNPKELTSQCEIPTCQYGRKQALPSDFDYSGYKMMPLLPPELIGWDLGQKVATFIMTNVVPLEPTVYSVWKMTLQIVRKFAIETCRIPVELPYQETEQRRRDGHDLPELYLLSGTVAPLDHVEVIGNDVVVPEIVWMGACCAHGADVSSFGIYSYNQYGQIPAIVSLENLHVLLQSMYYDNVDKINIDLFPAFDGLCSYIGNDVSSDLIIT